MSLNLLEYTKLIEMITKKFPSHYKSDLMNEGYLAVVDAHRYYDETKGEFEVYAKKWVFYAMLKFVTPDTLTDSLDMEISQDDGETTTFKDLLEDTTDYEQLMEDADYFEKHLGNLNQIERFIKRKYFVDGLSVEQIIGLYSHWTLIKNPKTVYRILQLKKK